MNTKTKSTTSKILLIALALIMVLGALIAVAPLSASAATNRAGAYYLYGTYDIGDGSKSGYLSDFKIQISTQYFTDDSASNGTTKYNNATFPWTYFSFYIYATDIDEHVSFKLTRNGSTYTSKSLSGDGSGYDTLRSLEEGIMQYPGCVLVTSHDRWFLDRLATHILAYEDEGHVEWFEGNFEEYEKDKVRRLGEDALRPHRSKHKTLTRQ